MYHIDRVLLPINHFPLTRIVTQKLYEKKTRLRDKVDENLWIQSSIKILILSVPFLFSHSHYIAEAYSSHFVRRIEINLDDEGMNGTKWDERLGVEHVEAYFFHESLA